MNHFKKVIARIMVIISLTFIITPEVSSVTNSPAVITAQAAYNRATVKSVQQKLNRLGYKCGTPDGVAGTQTKKSITKYQKSKNLKATGTINSSLLSSLGVKNQKVEATVYVTETGSKYHTSGCRYLWNSKIAMKLSRAKSSYDPCSVCNP